MSDQLLKRSMDSGESNPYGGFFVLFMVFFICVGEISSPTSGRVNIFVARFSYNRRYIASVKREMFAFSECS